MAEPFVIVNRRCLPSPALPFSFLPPWLFYLLRKQKRSRVSAQGRKCTQRLGLARARLCHPPTAAGAPRCHRHEGDTPARLRDGRAGRDAPGIRRSIGTAPCRHRLYRSEQQWEILHRNRVIWVSRKSCIRLKVGLEGYFLP